MTPSRDQQNDDARLAFSHGPGASIGIVCAVVCAPHVAELGLRPLVCRLLPRRMHGAAIDVLTLVLPACVACICESARSLALLYAPLLVLAATRLLALLRSRPTSLEASAALRLLNAARSPALTRLRSTVTLLTAFCILAVDFPLFPRAHAKTLNYGRSVMDLGVGAVVLAGSLTSARRRGEGGGEGGGGGGAAAKRVLLLPAEGGVGASVRRVLVRHAPLVAAGFGRIAVTRAASYHEVHSEYGVHWNFFFTLAAVAASTPVIERAAQAMMAAAGAAGTPGTVGAPPSSSSSPPPPSSSSSTALAALAALVIVLHQAALSLCGLSAYVRDESAPRVGLLSANKEGLASLPGYLALSLAGRAASRPLLRVRRTLREWWRDVAWQLLTFALLLGCSAAADVTVEPSSRRLCNLSYVLWVAAQVAGVLGCATLASIASSLAPSSAAHSARAAAAAAPPLLEAVNRHPLSLFLLANLLTGACNLSMDTMAASDATAAAVLAAYMLAVCAAAAAVCL
jgi:phosphatidylinositol glycan class W